MKYNEKRLNDMTGSPMPTLRRCRCVAIVGAAVAGGRRLTGGAALALHRRPRPAAPTLEPERGLPVVGRREVDLGFGHTIVSEINRSTEQLC